MRDKEVFIVIEEAAVRLHRSGHTVRRLLATGRLRGQRIMGRIYIAEADVLRLLQPEPVTRATGRR